jgi:hypothetical protein
MSISVIIVQVKILAFADDSKGKQHEGRYEAAITTFNESCAIRCYNQLCCIDRMRSHHVVLYWVSSDVRDVAEEGRAVNLAVIGCVLVVSQQVPHLLLPLMCPSIQRTLKIS